MKILPSSRIPRSAAAAIALAALVLAVTASTALAALQSVPDATYQTNGRVHVIMRVDGVIYVGGSFSSVRPSGDPPGTGEAPRSNVFAEDAHTGALLPWTPQVNGIVRALAAGPSGASIFLGGDFTTVNGISRSHLAAVTACSASGPCPSTLQPWAPRTNGNVFALATLGGRVYFGGSFGNVNGTHKTNLAAVGLSSGKLLRWGAGADNEVRAILPTPNGTRVMVGGYFGHIGASAQLHLAALGATTGAPLPWLSHPPFPVLGLAATSSRLYAGGAGGGGHLWSFLLSTGHVGWQAVANGDVTQVSPYHGDVLAVGHFNTFGAQTRQHLALINGTTGKVDPNWHPFANSPLGTFAGLAYGQHAYAGGDFTSIGPASQQGFVGFSDTVADNTAPTITRAPDVRMAVGSTIGATIPVTLSWAGADNLAGVCRFMVQQSVNSGAFGTIVPAFPKATSMGRALRPNFAYRFKAAAKDCEDNTSGFATGPLDRIGVFQNSSTAISYAGHWTRNARVAGASGGSLSFTTQRNASATLHFTGRQIAWVATRAANRGRATVSVDGHPIKVVDLHSTTTLRRRIVFIRTFTSAGPHTIRVICQGTAGRPVIDVDAFLVLR